MLPEVVVVAGNVSALDEFRNHQVYVCQEHRNFAQDPTHMAVYAEGCVYDLVLKIEAAVDSVVLTPEGIQTAKGLTPAQRQKLLGISGSLLNSNRTAGAAYKVFFLASPDSTERGAVIRLGKPVPNNCTDKNGDPCPFTYGSRYVTMARLLGDPNSTTDLIAR